MNFELNDDEYETLKDIFNDWGSDCPYTDTNKRQALGEKLGILDPIPEPTEEELKRREEFRNSPYGLLMSKMMTSVNYSMDEMLKNNVFMRGSQWDSNDTKIGTTLKIRLPNDYLVENKC